LKNGQFAVRIFVFIPLIAATRAEWDMHEAAIVQSVIEIAETEARRCGASNVSRIKLKIGEFRGVVTEALEFAFAVLRKGTLAAEADLEIETVRLRVECGDCGPVDCSLSDFNLLCPQCGGMLAIIAGREMQVEYIDVD
jgi:hydrogenase nickel incorporation protein HypA/HybF